MKEMPKKAEYADVAVVVGRFQVHELHQAHQDLIKTVCDKHDKIIIFLGLSPVRGTINNPLDFESRKQMILEKFPHVNVLYIEDVNNDEVWSKKLDDQIGRLIGPTQTVALYGSRDSFIAHYTGKYDTIELESDVIVSGTEIRKKIRNKVKPSADFRAGAIWSTGFRYPTTFTTVDIAILDDEGRVLLAKKPNEELHRFVGGFSDPNDESFEASARREVIEETGLEIGYPEYIGSAKISDWRYVNERDKIKTIFFKVKRIYGAPRAQDDIESLKWFDISKLEDKDIVPEHRPLMSMLKKNLNIPITIVGSHGSVTIRGDIDATKIDNKHIL
jgi:bifunctional NMN adenylyltransferase/nudix hydrolase